MSILALGGMPKQQQQQQQQQRQRSLAKDKSNESLVSFLNSCVLRHPPYRYDMATHNMYQCRSLQHFIAEKLGKNLP